MTKYTDFINYHLSMLVDDVRTGSYGQAISKMVKTGDVVVDVGCGSGILSFLACRAGAKHVYAVENEAVIEMAKLVAAKNGLQNRITFFNDVSFAVELPEQADVIVTETMGTFGFVIALSADKVWTQPLTFDILLIFEEIHVLIRVFLEHTAFCVL